MSKSMLDLICWRLTDLGIGLGWLADDLVAVGAASSSDDESLLSAIVEGPLLATLR